MESTGDGGARTVGEVGERGILTEVFGVLAEHGAGADGLLVGPGDDTAHLRVRSGAVLATTDTMVRGQDWLDEWSTGEDVGHKIVTQNLADLASMGGRGTGVLITLLCEPELPLAWCRDLTTGLARACARAGVPVVGGDLSAAGPGVVAVSVTALGELGEGIPAAVLRSGARPGDVLAVSGPLGRSGAGLGQLRAGRRAGRWVDHHRRPWVDLEQGPVAARVGATAMIDVSDGLGRDGARVARASGVDLVLDEAAVAGLAGRLAPEVGEQDALRAVLGGGEEHELLATFPPGRVPAGWVVLGRVEAAQEEPGVRLGEQELDPSGGGWDHFGG
ncbi:Thiamine-monophosphate kinase [Serinicoccus hydrothermalis]|uniref:Thiamine-monophosphate kinase n=1 Tax=Serinicoccus hydrothermalis TaxID=1758689 RepID=A0A1B1NGT9_9MICO|nr:thiamine-phosphate kinase [Serinicoccus hydrothermalis]ANS80638.1 Thiamine-monophosphate kinase [Serinicoccus hydrothermalis]